MQAAERQVSDLEAKVLSLQTQVYELALSFDRALRVLEGSMDPGMEGPRAESEAGDGVVSEG